MGKEHLKNLSKRQPDIQTNFNQENQNAKNQDQKFCLLFTQPGTWSLTLLIIDASGDYLSSNSFSSVKLVGHCFPDVGFGSLESKCYVIGGDVYPHGKPLKGLKLPRKVFVCDLNRTIKSWEEGPMLVGGKPNPIVVTVNGKLYALAGTSDLWRSSHKNLFEVFEPKYGMWRVLPNPPFDSLYKKGYPHPKFQGNTVIGSVIYLQIELPIEYDCYRPLYSFNVDSDDCYPTLYSFNVDSERWTEYSGGSDGPSSYKDGSDDLVIHNLRVSNWVGTSDVVDYLMFRTTDVVENLNVLAYDLSRNIVNHEDEEDKLIFVDENDSFKDESDSFSLENYFCDAESLASFEFREYISEESENINEEGEHSFQNRESGDSNTINKYKRYDYKKEEYVLMVNDDSLTIPVFGLTHIDRSLYRISSLTSCVTHLGGNLFSLVSSYAYRNYKDIRVAHVRVCIFEASFIELSDGVKLKDRYVVAHNVRESKWIEPETESLIGWCKVPNDGRQSQFRRPQLQYGKKSSGYPDYVAGRIIEKENTFHRYVRRVNLPQQ